MRKRQQYCSLGQMRQQASRDRQTDLHTHVQYNIHASLHRSFMTKHQQLSTTIGQLRLQQASRDRHPPRDLYMHGHQWMEHARIFKKACQLPYVGFKHRRRCWCRPTAQEHGRFALSALSPHTARHRYITPHLVGTSPHQQRFRLLGVGVLVHEGRTL